MGGGVGCVLTGEPTDDSYYKKGKGHVSKERGGLDKV